jgi:hypothetical protein
MEAGRKVGFFLLLVGGSAALGFIVAWPLWIFATSARQAYTITVLALGVVGIVLLVVRASQKRRQATRDAGNPRRSPLAVLLGVIAVVVGIVGAYSAAVLIVHKLWILAAVAIVLSSTILWMLSRARNALKARKVRSVHAENRRE